MQLNKSYLLIICLFTAFLVVSTLQLGKSRTTISVLEKKKIKATGEQKSSNVPRLSAIEPAIPAEVMPVDTTLWHTARPEFRSK